MWYRHKIFINLLSLSHQHVSGFSCASNNHQPSPKSHHVYEVTWLVWTLREVETKLERKEKKFKLLLGCRFLVGGNWLPSILFSQKYWVYVKSSLNWRTHIFQRGGEKPPTSFECWWPVGNWSRMTAEVLMGMTQMIFEGKTQGSTIRNKDWMERNPSVFCDEWKPTEKENNITFSQKKCGHTEGFLRYQLRPGV